LIYIAHTKDGKNYTNDYEAQQLKTHLVNVSKYAEKFASSFGAGEVGSAFGLLHDFGKYSYDFQKRIRGQKIRVDHSTLGAKYLMEYRGEIGRLYGMVIAGHHTGLKNSGCGTNIGDDTYSSQINDYKKKDEQYPDEIEIPRTFKDKIINNENKHLGFAFSTYLKMLFSSLVDADWTDTEEYVTGIKREPVLYSMLEFENILMQKMPKNDGSKINNIRANILASCISAADSSQGLFTLTVPTGGGKTLSSLMFAVKHAVKHKLKRIIYVIPYTSIIEQNADVISKRLGKKYVLEHHSNVDNSSILDKVRDNSITANSEDIDSEKNSDVLNSLRWASENWDIPIILTTNVQFFESFFSNKPSKTRKLHNVAESVVIFDEAQMLPREFLSPSMYAISELVQNYKVTAVLCSATQPAISKYKYEKMKITEIIDNPANLAESLKRVEYEIIGKKTNEEIVEIIRNNPKVLCIVNSRKHAYSLFKLAQQHCTGNTYHLSTLMCPMDRRGVIKHIKEKLQTNENVIVISTSLIEAGVDIDFPLVMRSIAGIDSIVQAGGRANREGKIKLGKVLIFDPISDTGKPPRAIQNSISFSKEVMALLKEKAFGLEGISKYFNLLYNSSTANNVLDSKEILKEFSIEGNNTKLNFETVAKNFKLIEENTKSIIINLRDSESEILIKQIRSNNFNIDTIRKLQQYTVAVYMPDYTKLKNDNVIDDLENGFIILNNDNYYNEETGLDIFSDNNKNAECSII